MYHIPALLTETIDGLNIKPDGTYVDVTFGGGGHSRAILAKLGDKGRLIAFDQDEDAMQNSLDDSRFQLVRSNFRYLSNFLKYLEIEKVDGILADLGVSFHHFDESERGFSFRFEGKLDMRMNMRSGFTAEKLINEYTEQKLADVLYLYGELHNSRRIANAIVRARGENRIATIEQLIEILKPFTPRDRERKELAKIFQALRIEVNREMEVLKELLAQSIETLKPEGRLVVLTYHSLEDRLVKNFIRSGNFEGKQEKDFYGNIIAPMKAVNNKVIVANEEEVAANPRSRSAKLRVASLIGQKSN